MNKLRINLALKLHKWGFKLDPELAVMYKLKISGGRTSPKTKRLIVVSCDFIGKAS